MNQLIPESFFADHSDVKPVTNVFGDIGRKWKPSTAMMWYDGIIDDMFANPGTNWKETAARLGRSHNVISTIVNSDLFKARYQQRREQFDQALNAKLTDKLAKVAEAALDHTLTVLETKRDSIPLPLLQEVAHGSLDRLGYSPSKQAAPAVQVNVDNRSNSQTVSAEGLARARDHLRMIESSRGVPEAAPAPPTQPEDVAGRPSVEVEEEG